MEEIDFEASNRLQNANTYGDISFSDIDFEASNSLRNDALRKLYPREADAVDMGVIIGTELLGTVLGGIATGGSPLGFAGGSALGNYLSQQYRINQGLQSDVGLGELGAATVLGGVPVGKFANVGMAGKTAIRAGQGAGLATGELLARTYIDEDRAPTQEEIATTLLFGGVFGGTLGAVEAKFLKDGTGVDLKPGMTRPEVKDALASNIKDKGGVENASVGNPLVKEILETNDRIAKARQEYYNTPDPFAGSADEVAGNVLQGIENKLLKETEQAIGEIDNPVQGGILEQLKFDNQSRDNLRNAFNAKLASDNEIFTGVNPIVAKGNIADTRRLREIDEEIAKIDHRGKSTKQRKQLEKEKRALERKHNIVQNVLLGGAGVASVGSMFTEDEEASGSSLAMAGFLGFFGIRKSKKVTDAMARGANKAKAKNASDEAIRAKGGTPTPEPEPIGRAAVEAERKQVASSDRIPAKRIASVDDIKRYYSDELIEQLENTNDPNLQNIFAEELAERASRQTPRGRALRDKLLKISLSERNLDVGTFSILNKARNTPPGTQKINPNVRGLSQANKFELAQAARNGDEQAVEEIRKRAAKNPRTKKFFEKEGLITGLLTTGTGAIALMEMMDDDDDSVSRASLGGGELLIALALGTLGYKGAKKFTKSAEFKKAKAQIKANPSAAEPDIIKQARIDQTLERNPFAPPSEFKEAMKSAQDFVRNALQPMSRTLKNINKALPAVFRKHEKEIAVRTREYMDKVSPFIVSMTKRLKDNPNKQRLFKQYLLNGEYTKISDEILTPNAPQVLFDQMGEMRKSLDDLRSYARQRGGIDVGYIEAYFPRKIKNYSHFRKALDEEEGLGGIRTELDKALDDYAANNNFSSRDAIPTDEAAEVVSRALRTPPSGGMTPGNVKMRSIESVSPKILDAYADPAEALGDYVQRMVQATERRNFLLRKPDASGSKVGFQGSQDTINADLGMRMEVSEDMVGALADRLRRENKLSQEDVDKLKEVIRARFNSKTVSPFFQGVKNANYIAVMGNFGSAITQLGDLAYSIHFNGFDNTFKTLFNRKDNFDFVKHFGLSDSSIDAATSTQGLSKVLDNVFTFTQLKRLDQLGKNTTMNASWKKFKAQAQKDAPGLADELAPVFGRERAGEMVKQLQQSNPASKNLPKAVEELIWYKFLDLSPATLGEMPLYYNTSGNMRIAYMLKSFTLKQFDVFREAGSRDIEKAKLLYKEGKTREAVKSATKGMNKVLGLAVVFAAANASTDVIKDLMYGRPIKKDELLADNILKLAGINRYLSFKAKREGIGKAVLETMLPPMTIFDRGGKDLDDFVSGKEYKGNLFQGTPLDIIYWRYLGGVDKVKNMQ